MASYSIERYMDMRLLKKPVFGPDDERLFFISDLSGQRALWELSAPREWPRQRTFVDGDVLFGTWSPTGGELAFGVDPSGDDRLQLYLLDDGDETVHELTDDPEVLHRWGGWSSDGTRFAYAANRRRPGAFDVFVQGRGESPDASRLVYEQERPSPLVPLGWGPDDERLVVLERHSSFSTDVHLVDVESGDATLLTNGPGANVRYRSITWGPDGDSMYLITDRDSNWLYAARLDLETGDLEPVVRTDANVTRMVLHAEENRLAYIESRNGYSEVTTAELRGPTEVRDLPSPEFPEGSVENMTMSSDGSKLGVVFYPPDGKQDVYVIDVETGRTTQWTDVSPFVPEDNLVPPEAITYESFDGLEIPSFYATPGEADAGPNPAVIFLHGGPRQQSVPTGHPFRQYALDRGYVQLDPNFRGSSGYGKEYMRLDDVEKRPDAIRDVGAAADWLAAREEVDGDRLVLLGVSYGGFLVLAAMTRWPNRFAAGVAVSPIVDFETYLENTSSWRRKLRAAEYGSLEEDRELLRELSPIHDVENVESPLLLIHGENDSRIPVEQVRTFADRAHDQGVPVETMFEPDVGHRLGSRTRQVEIFGRIADFIDDYVRE